MEHQIICGDSLELIKMLPDNSIDAVISDVPYGENMDGLGMLPTEEMLLECIRVSKGCVIWFGAIPPKYVKAVLSYDPLPDRVIFWHVTFTSSKTSKNGVFYRTHPIYCWNLPKKQYVKTLFDDIINCTCEGKCDWFHPATKPIELMKILLAAFVKPGGTVLDPYCGSGTTNVAAATLGMQSIGFDREEKYVKIARKRLLGVLKQPELVIAKKQKTLDLPFTENIDYTSNS